MSMSVNSLMSAYTYGYGSGAGVRAKLDKNDDALWNREEVANYADAYNQATGKTIDVNKLFETYGDENGNINYAGQEAIRKADALDLKSLKPEDAAYKSAAPSASDAGKTPETQKSTSEILSDLMSNMSTSAKVSFSNMIYKNEQMSNMFNMFNSSNPLLDFSNSMGFGSKAGSASNWSSYVGQFMNMMV